MKKNMYLLALLGLMTQLNADDRHTMPGLILRKEAYLLGGNSSELNWVSSLEKRRVHGDDYVSEEGLREQLNQRAHHIQEAEGVLGFDVMNQQQISEPSEQSKTLDSKKSQYNLQAQIQQFFMKIIASLWGEK